MIQPVKDFVAKFLEDKHFENVLEVGSRDVGPGSIKPTFLTHYDNYVGLDMIEGAEVDIVLDAELLLDKYAKDSFDCVVCVETLEHVKNPVKIVENMRAVLKPGGWMIITTPGTHHPEHGWPSDYYRYIGNTYRDIFFEGYDNFKYEEKVWEGESLRYPDAQFGYGQKPDLRN